jgi:hypothetical protein
MIKSKSLLIFSVISALLLASCSSTKSDFALTEDATETMNEKTNAKKKKEKKQFVLFKYGNIGDYISVDETSVFVPNVFGSLKQKKATVTIDPKKNEAGFGSSYLAAYYYLFWDTESRKAFLNSIDSYFSDFENKRLNRKLNTSEKVYGKADVRLRWGALSNSTPNNGKGKMYLGYKFKEKSPFFSITIYPVFNEYSKDTGAVDKESMMLTYYFNKSQLADLQNMLSDETIAKALFDYTSDDTFSDEIEIDEYSEEYAEEIVE